VYVAAGTHTGAVYVWRLGWAELENAAKGRRGGRHASRGGGAEGDDATVVSAGTYASSHTHATHASHASSIGDGEGGAAADDGKKVGIEGTLFLTRTTHSVARDPHTPPIHSLPVSSSIARQLHSLLQSSEYPIVHLALSAAVDPGRLYRPLSRPLSSPFLGPYLDPYLGPYLGPYLIDPGRLLVPHRTAPLYRPLYRPLSSPYLDPYLGPYLGPYPGPYLGPYLNPNRCPYLGLYLALKWSPSSLCLITSHLSLYRLLAAGTLRRGSLLPGHGHG